MIRLLITLIALLLAYPAAAGAQRKTLDIYWIDVEGGAATLLISPEGESLLYDAGWDVDNNRDAHRIAEVAKQAGLSRIDLFVLSHFHADHAGGLTALAALMPIGRYFDHGNTVVDADRDRLITYAGVAGRRRTILKAGDSIPFEGVEAKVVSSNGLFIKKGINNGGDKNPACDGAERKPPAPPENGRNVGTLFTYGNFTFLDLADLDWASEMKLACPKNLLGRVTIWQTSRHGALDGAGAPALLSGIRPQVIVANNGPRKGLGQSSPPSASYERIAALPGVESIWQGHRALADPGHNAPDDFIANFEDTADCKGHWIKASVSPEGTLTMTNGRNGFSKTYNYKSPRSAR